MPKRIILMALALPMSWSLIAVLYMLRVITFIGWVGAPDCVKRYWVLNVFRH